jgi:hypothetical protein
MVLNRKPRSDDDGGRTRISATVLDRLIKAKMARMPECDGVTALPVVRLEESSRGCNWRVPGYAGDGVRVANCEAAIRDYLEFLAAQFDLADES